LAWENSYDGLVGEIVSYPKTNNASLRAAQGAVKKAGLEVKAIGETYDLERDCEGDTTNYRLKLYEIIFPQWLRKKDAAGRKADCQSELERIVA
ncbi:hypothetical protein KKB68_00470, partial [Patescibacteria group bacterium]|nr:hypothetical protein [Patescibacteria group bacterium]